MDSSEPVTDVPARASRSRRGVGAKAALRAANLERLRQEKGKKRSEGFELEDEGDVYETVTEEDYVSMVEKRRNEEFVVDDDGLGYYDDGEEHLFDKAENRGEKRKNGSRFAGALSADAVKRARLLDAKKKGDVKKVSTMFLARGNNVIGPSKDGKKKSITKTNAEDDDLLESLMGSLTDNSSGGSLSAALGMGSNADFAEAARKRAAQQKKKRQNKLRNIEDMALFTGSAQDLAAADGELQTTIEQVRQHFFVYFVHNIS